MILLLTGCVRSAVLFPLFFLCSFDIQTLVTNGLLTLRCLNCNHETFRHDASHVTTLTYPDMVYMRSIQTEEDQLEY